MHAIFDEVEEQVEQSEMKGFTLKSNTELAVYNSFINYSLKVLKNTPNRNIFVINSKFFPHQ